MERQSFSEDWKFQLGNFDRNRFATPDVSEWHTLDLPHDWSIELERNPESISGVASGFFPMGIGWYQKAFTPPSDWQEKIVYIEFEGVSMNAEIWLNQNLLGCQPATQKEKYPTNFQIPNEPGELKAIGYRGQKRVAVFRLQTAGASAQILLIPDRDNIKPGGDLGYVTVQVLDENSILHPKVENTIPFHLEGPRKILAVGSSNPVSVEPYVGNQHSINRGSALVVIRSYKISGEITLHAQSDGLEPARVRIQS